MLIVDSSKPTHLIIIQPTMFCNINCSYCYLPNRHIKGYISEDVLRAIFANVLSFVESDKNITFVWHSGEPLSASIDLYEKAFGILQEENLKFNRDFKHYIQTNGMLINAKWVELFLKHQVHIGLSLDGPAFIHDKFRVSRDGKGTHSKVMSGLKLLQSAQIPLSIISVLTDFALDYPDEMFSFFIENNLVNLAFNVEEIEGANKNSSLDYANGVKRYKFFMQRFFQLATQADIAIRVRELSQIMFRLIYQKETTTLCNTNIPQRTLTFDRFGNYSTFSPELMGIQSERHSDFIMGNILKDPLASMKDNSVYQLVSDEVQQGVSLCQSTCAYWDFCGGGHPSNKFAEHGRFDTTETLQCRYQIKTLIDAVTEQLDAIDSNLYS